MEKTIHEWLNELGEPHRTKAVNNCKAFDLKTERESLASSLLGAFDWRKSPEGYKYWFNLYITILDAGL